MTGSATPLHPAEIGTNPAIAAATLVIMRSPVSPGSDEILFLKRSADMAFAAGAVVFPGGRVDPDDDIVAQRHGFAPGDTDGAARVAAVRETLEETGLAIGWPGLSEEEAPTIRQALLAGQLLSDILTKRGERLTLDILVPFARWCPNFKHGRSFDTLFFAVQCPDHGHELTVEEAEHSHIFWASARTALDLADAGEFSVIFPTRRNLERLAHAPNFHAFCAHAAQYPIEVVTPWVEEREGEPHLCIPDDLGYPVTSEPLDSVRRR